MKKKIAELENDFITFIQYGRLILNCTESEIREHFSEDEITVPSDPNTNKLMEIRLSYGTLTCQFNDDNICSSGFLFFDDSILFNVYREICNDQCEIVCTNVWKYDNYYIMLKSYISEFYFTFCLQQNGDGSLM